MGRAVWVLSAAFVLSTLCWFPMQMRPGFGWPIWLPPALMCLAAFACSMQLTRSHWLVPVASSLGALLADSLGFSIWWPDDPIAVSWIPIELAVVPVGAAIFAAIGAIIGYGWMLHFTRYSKASIGILAGIGIFCSTAIAANNLLVNEKIRYNHPIAEQRVKALYQAATLAIKESGAETSAQDSTIVRTFYRGPRFSDGEWEGMTRNLMRENGFVYQIHIEPAPATGILVYAVPIEYRERAGPGICLDDTGRMQCPLMVSTGQKCVPCSAPKH